MISVASLFINKNIALNICKCHGVKESSKSWLYEKAKFSTEQKPKNSGEISGRLQMYDCNMYVNHVYFSYNLFLVSFDETKECKVIHIHSSYRQHPYKAVIFENYFVNLFLVHGAWFLRTYQLFCPTNIDHLLEVEHTPKHKFSSYK